MGQEFAKNCCNSDVFIKTEDEETDLNLRRWKYINNEVSITSNEMTTTQPIHVEKNNITLHPFKPSSKTAKRVENLNELSEKAKKVMENLREFKIIKEREKTSCAWTLLLP